MKLLMDAVERFESGMMQLHGTTIINGEERLSEDAEKNQLEIWPLPRLPIAHWK